MIVRPCLGHGPRADRRRHAGAGERARPCEQRIAAQPGHFVAQYPVSPSLNPKWDGDALVPSAVVLRCFVDAPTASG